MKYFIRFIQSILIICGIGFFCLFAALMLRFIFNIGNVLGAAISLAVLLAGVFLNKIIAFCKKHYKSKKGKTFINTALTIIGTGVLCFCMALSSVIICDSTNADNQKTLIVLGCAVRGETPSLTLNSRINAAYDYLESNPNSVAVLSGGQGRDEDISEAQCMFNILTEKGIESNRLFIEDESVNTATNIEYSKKVIEENGLSSDIAVVSSDYHLKRATMICEKKGFKNTARISAASTFFDKPTFYLREVLGVIKEFIIK